MITKCVNCKWGTQKTQMCTICTPMSEERSGLIPGSWSGMEILAKVPPPAFFVRWPGLMQTHPSTLWKEWLKPQCTICEDSSVLGLQQKALWYSTRWVLQHSPCRVKLTTRRSSLRIKPCLRMLPSSVPVGIWPAFRRPRFESWLNLVYKVDPSTCTNPQYPWPHVLSTHYSSL